MRIAEIVTDDSEKIAALRAICERFLPHHMDAFDASIARSLGRTAVVRITLAEPPVGKRKQYDRQGEEMKYGRMDIHDIANKVDSATSITYSIRE